MKLKATFIFIVFAFLFSTELSAQVDRRVGREQYRNTRKYEKKDFIEESVKYLTKELTLDGFQQAAVKKIMEDERSAIMLLNEDKEMTTQEKRERSKAISDRIYGKVTPLLSKDQAAKYAKMEESKKF